MDSHSDKSLEQRLQSLKKEMVSARESFEDAWDEVTEILGMTNRQADLGPAPQQWREGDHYVVSPPFLDPFDCFDEPQPTEPFPSLHNGKIAPLQGLFEAPPRRGVTPATDGTSDVEIEFPEDGGYRMRYTPRHHAKNATHEDGLPS